MSRIYFHSPKRTSEVLGSERAYMNLVCVDLCAGLLAGMSRDNRPGPTPFERILPDGRHHRNSPSDRRSEFDLIRSYLMLSGDRQVIFGDRLRPAHELVLNTTIVSGSPPLALLARLEGTCEIHAWVDGRDRRWLAGVIEQGLEYGIMRPDTRWEAVAEHLRENDDEPVVTSYSASEEFPFVPSSVTEGIDLFDEEGWGPAEEEAARYEWETSTPPDERFRAAFDELNRDRPGLRIAPDNLHLPVFLDGATCWDAIQSDEWKGKR